MPMRASISIDDRFTAKALPRTYLVPNILSPASPKPGTI